jgi:hypothetical protein
LKWNCEKIAWVTWFNTAKISAESGRRDDERVAVDGRDGAGGGSQVLPDGRRKEIELPTLNRGNQARPEDRSATEIELRLFADVPLLGLIASLPERVAAKMTRQIGIRKSTHVVDVSGIEKRSGLQHENALLAAGTVGEVVGENAASDAGADDDDVEVIARADVLQEQPLLRGGAGRNQICVGGWSERHRRVAAR